MCSLGSKENKRMTKTKLFLPLFVILVMGMATSAFAQLSCSVASTPVSRATSTGHAEQAGDLIFNCTGGGTATTLATITVGYGVTITNNTVHPPLQPIAITNVTGVFVGAAPTVSSVSNTTGQVVITVPANAAAVGATGSFSLVGVRVSLNGTGITSLNANVSVSPGNGVLITAGQNVATVITAILPGINTTTAPPALVAGTQSALYFASSGVAVPGRGTFAFTVTENYIDAFRDQSQIAGATNDTQILVTLTGLPTGTSITGCTAALSGAATAVQINGGVAAATITAAAPTMVLDFVGPTNIAAVETITVTCTGFAAPASALPLSATITGTVTLAPIGQALSAAGAVLTTVPGTTVTSGSVPRYASSTSSLGTLLSFTPSTTTMIIPLAMGDPSTTAVAGTFDTGIAIANTTADTVGGTSIFATGGAVPQAGTITFTFFPSDGTAANRFSVTTASVVSGASYIANVSEILRAGGRTSSFVGYIIAVANFTNAHGTAFIYGGSTAGSRLTSATDLLVIPSPVAASRSSVGGVDASLVEETSH
jgi:hypothetical protein